MKNWLLIVLAALGILVIWQWWISRRNTALWESERNRKEADKAGQAAETTQMAGRPRIMSDEAAWQLQSIVEGASAIWSQIFSDGSVNNSGSKEPREPAPNPFVFGYGRN